MARPSRKPHPHADRAERGQESQREADRRADRPIAEKGDDKGLLGIVQAPQHVGEDALACVEDLEDGRYFEQRDRRLRRRPHSPGASTSRKGAIRSLGATIIAVADKTA